MREDVLSLKAMAGDRVSLEYLKADLYHRAEALKDIPDAPLFFGRLDYATPKPESPKPESPKPESPKPEYLGPEYLGPGNPTPGMTAWRGTASTSAAGTCTTRTARPP